PDVGVVARGRREGLFDLGDAEVADGPGGAAALRSSAAQRDVRESDPQPDDSRGGVLVPASGQRVDGDAARLRRADVRQLRACTSQTDKGGNSWPHQFLDSWPA